MTSNVSSLSPQSFPASTINEQELENSYNEVIKQVRLQHFLYAEKLAKKMPNSNPKVVVLDYLRKVQLGGVPVVPVYPKDTTSKVHDAAAGESSAPLATSKAKSDEELFGEVLKYNKPETLLKAFEIVERILDTNWQKKAFTVLSGEQAATGGSGGAPALPAPKTETDRTSPSAADVAKATAAADTSTPISSSFLTKADRELFTRIRREEVESDIPFAQMFDHPDKYQMLWDELKNY